MSLQSHNSRHESGEIMSLDPEPSPNSQFLSKPFPPPSLVGVPIEYIIDQLHNLAPHYWDKPDTADCTISTFILFFHIKPKSGLVVPVPYARGTKFPPNTPSPSYYDPAGRGRRITEPTINFVPRIVLKVCLVHKPLPVICSISSFSSYTQTTCPLTLVISERCLAALLNLIS